MKKKSVRKATRILVIGDWVVDEHWVTSIHRSGSASRTGRAHYRALHNLDSCVQSLAAAGRITSILSQAKFSSGNDVQITALGAWNTEDDLHVASMLGPRNNIGKNPFSCAHSYSERPENTVLMNLSSEKDGPAATNRVIRICQHIGSRIELLDRVDWELPTHHDEDDNPSIYRDDADLRQRLQQCQIDIGSFDIIVVKDLMKGVISGRLISEIVKRANRDARWFISSKAWNPPWLSHLQEVRIEMLLVEHVSARLAVRNNDLNCWLTKDGAPSTGALNQLDSIADRVNGLAITMVMPSEFQLLVRIANEDSKVTGIAQSDRFPIKRPEIAPMATSSVLFSSIIACAIENDSLNGFGRILDRCLSYTCSSAEHEVLRVREPITWKPTDQPILTVSQLARGTSKMASLGTWDEFDWKTSKTEWEQALNSCGIVNSQDKAQIQLWRAMTDLEGYACCVPSKQLVLRQILRLIDSHLETNPPRHSSCMVSSSPGSGKSYFVKLLAKKFRMPLLTFNVAQMQSRIEILEAFDAILAAQAESRSNNLMVFVDEINASIDGQSAYGSFLTPLEGGSYARAGKTFHIDPCFWIFAGTGEFSSDGIEADAAETKINDFVSRLTLKPLSLDAKKEEVDEVRLERVYLGVTFTRRLFPDVRGVTQKVLTLFHMMPADEIGIRGIEQLVGSFSNVQYGIVHSRNISLSVLTELEGFDTDIWRGMEEGEIVEIVT